VFIVAERLSEKYALDIEKHYIGSVVMDGFKLYNKQIPKEFTYIGDEWGWYRNTIPAIDSFGKEADWVRKANMV